MSEKLDVQKALFQKVKEKLPTHTSLVDEIAERLSISSDGVYRRLRNETPLRLDEAAKLCQEFNISLDEIVQENQNHSIVFQPTGIRNGALQFEEYLHGLLGLFTEIQNKGVKSSLYAAKDIPVFHLYQFPELALFKMFFWRKTIYNDPELNGKQFELNINDESQDRCISLCKQIAEKYALIPSTEIWNEETSYSFVKQIGYYYEAGLFKRKQDAILLCEQVEALFVHLKKEAELGYKFMADNPPESRVKNFWLYYNDLILIDNVIVVDFEDFRQAFLIYNSIDYLSTRNPVFAEEVKIWLENITRKSELISEVAERMRNKFFMKTQRKIEGLKEILAQ
ncbi:MAG: helix-turn-helix transcriptional regulator [Bacteroidia bacterium]|nr:helix-turn-helix transcriptional regulator [Bacteroidia bacterium]